MRAVQVTYKDHMEDDENLFIIMGYCENGDLHTKIKVTGRPSCEL